MGHGNTEHSSVFAFLVSVAKDKTEKLQDGRKDGTPNESKQKSFP
jgi:hypothetical protein